MMRISEIPTSIVTRNVAELANETGNVYEAVAIVSKRANQISTKLKAELNEKLAEFATNADNLEEVFENREQIEISRQFERMPKPSNLAIDEFTDKKIYTRVQDLEEMAAAEAALLNPMN